MDTKVVLKANRLANGRYGIEFTIEEHTGKKVHAVPVTPEDEFPDREAALEGGKTAVETYMRQMFGMESDEYVLETS